MMTYVSICLMCLVFVYMKPIIQSPNFIQSDIIRSYVVYFHKRKCFVGFYFTFFSRIIFLLLREIKKFHLRNRSRFLSIPVVLNTRSRFQTQESTQIRINQPPAGAFPEQPASSRTAYLVPAHISRALYNPALFPQRPLHLGA